MAPLGGIPQALWQSLSCEQLDGQVFPPASSPEAPLELPPLEPPVVAVPLLEPPVGVVLPPLEPLPEVPVRLLSDPEELPVLLSSKFEVPLWPLPVALSLTSAPFFAPEPQATRIAAAPTQTIDFAMAMTRSLRCVPKFQ
jgi:hypothetical protein